ncbi:Cuticle protein [Armadillidium vulgare]|nr:Cuticle protein [Armadillidium vulgare]
MTGSYSYTSPEGVPVQVSYVADEFGFRADSSTNSLPVGPAPPPHSVAQVRAAQEEFARKGQVFKSPYTKDSK